MKYWTNAIMHMRCSYLLPTICTASWTLENLQSIIGQSILEIKTCGPNPKCTKINITPTAWLDAGWDLGR